LRGVPGSNGLKSSTRSAWSTLKARITSLKKSGPARGSKLLEQMRSEGEADLVKKLVRDTTTKMPFIQKRGAPSRADPSTSRSLLQVPDYEFKFSSASAECQSTMRQAGYTSMVALDAAGSDDSMDMPWPAELAPCNHTLVTTIDSAFMDAEPDYEALQAMSGFCDLGCKDQALTWLQSYSATCGVDMTDTLVEYATSLADAACKSDDLNAKDCSIKKLEIIEPVLIFVDQWLTMDKLVRMYKFGCASGSDGSVCWTREWWFPRMLSLDDEESDFCNGEVTCESLGRNLCATGASAGYSSSDCCVITGLSVAATLSVAECSYSDLAAYLLQFIDASEETCSNNICANQASMSSWVKDAMDKIESCCTAPIAAPCESSTDFAKEMTMSIDKARHQSYADIRSHAVSYRVVSSPPICALLISISLFGLR